MGKRAVSPAAKADRREGILSVAADAFDRVGFNDTSMAWLASRCGLAKGTLYLYFPTKEALFLAVYVAELDAWFDGFNRRLAGAARGKSTQLAGLMVDALAERPRLPALAAILHTVLEHNIGDEEALAFKRHLFERVAETGAALETATDFLLPGDGARLLLRFHALVIGCWQAATPAPVARRILERDEFAPWRIDFSEELENTLVLLLEGWRRTGGGF